MDNDQSLTYQLYIEALKRLLESKPDRATELATNLLEDYLEEARKNSALHTENAWLRAQLQKRQRSPQLFPLPRI